MEGAPRTPESDRIHFAIIAIEYASKKLGISQAELTLRLQKHNLIENRLMQFYDTLHTQSAEYVADDIIETLTNYEADE